MVKKYWNSENNLNLKIIKKNRVKKPLLQTKDIKIGSVTGYYIPNQKLACFMLNLKNSAGFTTGPVGPGPRARDPGGPKIRSAKKKKKKREN